MATAIVPANLTAFRTATDSAATAATADTADLAESFDFTSNGKPFIVLAKVAAANGSVTLAMSAGDSWAAKATSIGLAPQAKTTAFYVESGYGVDSDGKITITATPASGKKLLTDHVLTLAVIQI
jgi:hypothetical protein